MSLSIFHSSDYAWLLKELVAAESRALSLQNNLFAQSTIWLASNADEWELQRAFADAHGIAANLNFAPLADGLWATSSRLLNGVAQRSPFGAAALRPKILQIIETRFEQKSQLWGWLPTEQSQRVIVVTRLAEFFARYVTYRQAMLTEWLQGADATVPASGASNSKLRWQRDLWRSLAKSIPDISKPHPFALLKGAAKPISSAPIHVFNPLGLAPLYEDAIITLSKTHSVSIYFFNPTALNWHDRADGLPRLMAALGQERRYAFERFAHWLSNGLASEFAFYSEPLPSMLDSASGPLPAIKLGFASLVTSKASSMCHAENKGSVVLHPCSSIAEQLLAVKTSVTERLASDSSLKASDVLVLLARQNDYQIAVRLLAWLWREPKLNTQGNTTLGVGMPYRLSGIAIEVEDPLLLAWTRVLKLLQSDFELDLMFEWFSAEATTKRLGLSPDDLNRLRDWITEAGIRRSLNGDGAHTWESGVEWLLMVYAGQRLEDEPSDLSLSGLELSQLGNLIGELSRFKKYLGELTHARNRTQWTVLLNALFDELVHFPSCDLMSEALVRDAINSLADIEYDFSSVVAYLLTDAGFLSAAGERANLQRAPFVTVAPLGALRGQPFKLVYLVGAEQIPLTKAHSDLDLMVDEPLRGDPSLRDTDLGAVLDIFVSASQAVAFTYIAKDPVSLTNLAEPMLISLIKRAATDYGFEVEVATAASTSLARFESVDADQMPSGLAQFRELEVSADHKENPLEIIGLLADPLRNYLRHQLGVSSFTDERTLEAMLPLSQNNLELWQRRIDYLRNPSALLRRGAPQSGFGKLLVAEADGQMSLASSLIELHRQAVSGLASARSMRWGLVIECLVKMIRQGDREFLLVAREDYLRIKVTSLAVLQEKLFELYLRFNEAPFVFGRAAALAYCKAISKPKVRSKDSSQRPGDEEAIVFEWLDKDGQLSHDVLWAQRRVDAIPKKMIDWLTQMRLAFEAAGLTLTFGDAVDLTAWVSKEVIPSEN
jgi:exodeoxyribonuclease V gamma subunit